MRRVLRAALAAIALVGCASVGEFVWVDQYHEPSKPDASTYLIGPGDTISVKVWNQEAMSTRTKVRADGRISMPFLNDVEASGLEPATLAKRLQGKLKDFIVNPVVTVALEEQAPFEVSVLGEVVRPGVYRIERNTGLLKVLANAGGLTQIAGRDRIFVLRPDEGRQSGQPLRIRFTYRALTQVQGRASGFTLQAGDVVVVE